MHQNNLRHKLLVSTDKNEDVVVESAGKVGSIVVTTDIMGRGTDIHVEEVEYERGLVVLQIGNRPNSRVERQFAGRAARQGEPGRYHRMLSLPELVDAGLFESQMRMISKIERENRTYIQNVYYGDILMNSTAEYYDHVVSEIDDALRWSESSMSSQRVQDYKMSSITDLIQVATIAKLDIYREVLKESLETKDDTEIRYLVAELSLPENKRKMRYVEIRHEEIAHLTLEELQNMLFDYTQRIANETIQQIREYSNGSMKTAKLSTLVKSEIKPEDYMTRLMLDYMDQIQDDFILKIDGISNSEEENWV